MCAVWMTAASLIGSQDAPHPRQEGLEPSERLAALVNRVRTEQQAVRTLEAGFIQIRESAMLVDPVESQGVFSFSAPDRVRWEYLSPNPISMLISGDEMTTWYRDIEQAERVQVGRHSQRVLKYLGAGSTMDDLLEYFSVSLTLPKDQAQPYKLELAPKFDKVAKRLQGMTVWIDSGLFLPLRLRYVEADGDVTDMRFENLQVNGALPDGRFNLDMPTTVEVRHVDLDRSTGLN
jgi:outer membrane lipoprotein carrier protein